MPVHSGNNPVRLPEDMNPNDEETFWFSWTDRLGGDTISSSSWVIPSGWNQESSVSNGTVIVDGTTYSDANGITLTTTNTKGRHKISNEIRTSSGNVWRRSMIINLNSCI